MSKYHWLCQINSQKHQVNQKSSLGRRFFGCRSAVNILLFSIIVVLIGVYLIQVNRTATSGFEMNSLNKKIQNLKESSQKLELQMADLQSMKNIQEATERLQLVASSKLEYIQPTEGIVALEK